MAPRGRAGDRRLALRQTPLQSLELAQFLAEKIYDHQRGDNSGTDQSRRTNFFVGQAEVITGDVCQPERDGARGDPRHHDPYDCVDPLFHPANMRQRLGRASLIGGRACLIPRPALQCPHARAFTRRSEDR
jgi:hypothetical protein